MRRVLLVAVLMAFLPTANAQDKGKSDLTTDAEFRLRDTFEQNESGGNTDAQGNQMKPTHHNGIDQRFKVDLKYKSNEKFSATATLLQSASWGQSVGDASVGDRGTTQGGEEPNFMSVNQAYASWMMSDNLHANFGRMNFAFGDGSVMAVNDWQKQPFAFDGVTVNYEMEFGRFTAFGFKYRDLSTPAGLVNASTSDPQHDAYGLVFDLKTMPEWLKAVNVHVIQDTADAAWGAPVTTSATNPPASVNTLQGTNALRYGIMGNFAFQGFDLKANYEMVSGKNTDKDATGAPVGSDPRTIGQSMYQAELGYSLPSFMASRFFIGYHHDSGTSKTDAATKSNTYDGYFHDKQASGLMEIVGWGNLTDTSLGWTLKPMDNCDLGIAYHMFSKTNGDDTTVAGTYGSNLFANTAATADSKTAIGNELDVWAEHKYEGGLSMLARLGYFTEGAWLKDSTTALVNNKSTAITQVMVQGKLTF